MVTTRLSCRPPEQAGSVCRDSEEFDCYLTSRWRARVAREPLRPREASVGTLRAGKDYLFWGGRSWGGRQEAHLDALVSPELHTGTPVLSAAPISPEQRS